MRTHLHSWTRWQIDRLFAGGLSPTRHRALLREVCACPSCSAVFSRYHAFEAMLCGALEEPSRLAVERMASAVFGATPAEVRAKPGRWAPRFLAPAAALACAAMVILVSRAPGPVSHRVPIGEGSRLAPAEIVARGPGAAFNAKTAETGFRLLRVVPREAKVDEGSELLVSDVVTFTYTNLRKGMRYLALLGIQEGGTVRWYYPGPESDRSILIEPERVDEPLNDGIRLSIFHRAGWLRVAAILLEGACRQGGRGGCGASAGGAGRGIGEARAATAGHS